MTDPQPLQTQASLLATAQQRQEQREAGIRANAFKQGREAERAEQAIERAKLTANHEGQLKGMAEAHKQDIARAVKEHRRGSLWFGIAIGAAAASVFVSVGFLTVVDRAMTTAFDRAQEIAAASTLVGAATQRRDE